MRRPVTVFMLVFCLLFAYSSLFAAEEVNQLGMHPFYKSRDLKKDDLLKIATEGAEEVKAGFEMAGYAELYDAFIDQLKTADINLIEVDPGDTIEWMIFKKRKKVEVKKDVVWTAKKPFTAYQFIIKKDGKEYEFIVPKVCGNISLKSEKVAKLPPLPPSKNKPPTCDLKVSPTELFTGQSVTMDASGSNDPEGSIASVKFIVTGPGGQVLEEKELTQAPYIYKTKLKKAGTCKVKVIVTDEGGKAIPASLSCEAEKEVTVLKRGFFIGDVALLYQADPAWFLPIRIGYMHKLSKSFGFIALVGVAPVVSGDDDKTAFLADLTLTYWPKKFFFGVGAGYFASEINKRVDLIVNTGYEIMPHFSLFLEGRVGFDEFDVIDKFGRIGIGFRVKY